MDITSLIKNFLLLLGVTIICLALLEAGAFGILYWNYPDDKAGSLAADSFIFEQRSKDGRISPDGDEVFPIKKDFHMQWTRKEFSVDVTTNSAGFREDFDFNYADITTIFFGDSFTFGHGVNVEDRYSNIYANHRGQQESVISFSYKNGFQPEHYEFVFKNTPSLTPQHVFVGLYLGNDFEADLSETVYDPIKNELSLPFRKVLESGEVNLPHEIMRFPYRELARSYYYSNFGALLFRVVRDVVNRDDMFLPYAPKVNSPNSRELELGLTDLVTNRAFRSLLRLRKEVELRQGSLHIVLIPQNFYIDPHTANPHTGADIHDILNSKTNLYLQVKDVCLKLSFSCMDAGSVLGQDDYFGFDAHWNSSGHRKVGIFLSEIIPK